ncbi:Uncharacterised protein [Porphyromonas crevioricanis]|uniref:Uncharacterized protein n=1 Tax=Porphyromonas crevioricanis TaxID=393921 RepID=A0A2X4PL83_9PORP|nr:hypothetical protein SAMN02745203_00643 [Porphyromonas crevioricanis]SQH73550.1 Uncharacterised protein [Porphyromonas crevioricanis]
MQIWGRISPDNFPDMILAQKDVFFHHFYTIYVNHLLVFRA